MRTVVAVLGGVLFVVGVLCQIARRRDPDDRVLAVATFAALLIGAWAFTVVAVTA